MSDTQDTTIDKNTIYTFYQGDVGEQGRQAYKFTISTEDRPVRGTTQSMPKKLGDGTFGMVFEAPSTVRGVGIFALKVLYESRTRGDLEAESAESRILEELKIGMNLPIFLESLGRNEDLRSVDPDFPTEGNRQSEWLVLPKAYSKEFTDFIGRSALESEDVKFTPFAYIMEKFDYTLKDLMEEDVAGKGGYARLRRSTLRERECSAITVLEQMARGLQILHAAALRHQDIKPGNIYVKTVGRNIVVRLGDLGFLSPHDPVLAGTGVASKDKIGIGTKHYRSIEQVDFNDTAECDVVVNSAGTHATLTTRDPKFLETIMNVGDLAFLVKSSTHRWLRIVRLEKNFKEGCVTVEVVQKVFIEENAVSGEPEANPLVNDKKTQVGFVKNPSARTDLFGLGSILYDMITVGRSPERFYELLRRFDEPNTHVKQRVLDLYTTWIAGTLEDPDINAIFSRVNGSSDRGRTVHIEVLSFLLKCMMSNARGSFYEEMKFAEAELIEPGVDGDEKRLDAVRAWASVMKEIEYVGNAVGAEDYVRHEMNVLTRPVPNGADSESTEVRSSGVAQSAGMEVGDDLQFPLSMVLGAYLKGHAPFEIESSELGVGVMVDATCEGDEEVSEKYGRAFRWIMTGLVLRRVTDWIEVTYREKPTALWSLAPEHVVVKGQGVVAWRMVLSGDLSHVVQALRARDPLLTRIRPFASRFEPIWWQFGMRRIRLLGLVSDVKQQGGVGHDAHKRVRFEFLDFGFVSKRPQEGDFILSAEGGRPTVLEVKGVPFQDVLEVRVCEEEGAEQEIESREETQGQSEGDDGRIIDLIESAYLVKKPNIVDYFGGMLSVYLYHFLIAGGVGQSKRMEDFPIEVYSGVRKYPLRFPRSPSERSRHGAGVGWPTLRKQTIELIMWLTLGGFTYFNGREVESDKEKWNGIMREMDAWFEALKEFGVKGARIDNWNLLTTSVRSTEVRDALCTEFDQIQDEEWESVCRQYVKSVGEFGGEVWQERRRDVVGSAVDKIGSLLKR